MVIVTGATGALGHGIVRALLEKLPASEVGVSVRDPEKAADLAERGVRVRQGDYDDPASLRDAFESASQILLVSSNVASKGGDPLRQHRNAIDAAVSVGAERIVYTSQIAAAADSHFAPARDHAATEAMLAQSGIPWTALRNGFYASSALMLLGEGPKIGIVAAPADGPVSWTTHDDLAAGAAAILLNPDRFEGATPPLTGSEALDLAALCVLAEGILGRPVERKVVSEDAMRERMTAHGLPETMIDISVGLYRAAQADEFAAVNSTLASLIGRSPIPLRDVLAQKLQG